MIPLTKGSKFNHQSSSEKRSQTCIWRGVHHSPCWFIDIL